MALATAYLPLNSNVCQKFQLWFRTDEKIVHFTFVAILPTINEPNYRESVFYGQIDPLTPFLALKFHIYT